MLRLVPLAVAAMLGLVFHAELWNAVQSLPSFANWDERFGWALLLPVTYILGMLLLRDGR